ncbi:MAG TPA: bifunctional tetrahydrofolate synthase/dihydrofolate synthase [Burkholderiales bacterium]|jgi:dihydrofolate synthase/folylpolyglutamate synthase|nr:bifunctional tetrahydrofolate synthase/dihydrofolate synthase [Burkholderiales bacterium]
MKNLAEWLAYIERQHPSAIAMGLERVAAVLGRMGVRLECPVITVTGTNGKGSTCAFLEAMLRSAGYRTALYTSPHLLRYNERVRIAGVEAADERLCEAFEAVEAARGGTPLTYFEYGTLAALWLFAREKVDAAVLEVGLGGRLDAVNVLAPDCAVLTSVGIDHIEYLGGSRESIGAEKAGIFRPQRPAVIAEPDVPASVLAAPGEKLLLGKDFGYAAEGAQWSYWGPHGKRGGLAWPALRGAIQLRNASAALCALDTLHAKLPLAMQDVRRGLADASLPGRFQVLPGRPQVILDVAHNPQAAKALAQNLGDSGFSPEVFAVCGMLRDKDISGVLRELASRVTRWHFATLPPPRGALADELAEHLAAIDAKADASIHESPAKAFDAAAGAAAQNDKIVVFGSFLTVGDVMAWLKRRT